jgi:hypothetical protein
LTNRILRLLPAASLETIAEEGEFVAFNVGPDGIIYVVLALLPVDYRTDRGFVKTIPDNPQRYRIVGLDGAMPVLDLVIDGEKFNIYHVQPLVNELLLVCCRSYYRGPDDFEKNGRVYSREGKFDREILLGDGIQSVQTTSEGIIWTSFFDEGIFGNYGWDNPVGASGLVAWDTAGNRLYEFQPGAGMGPICDCYALNVESEEDVWCYYYTEFPLVHLRSRKIRSVWKIPLAGSGAFAVSTNHALFCGGYKERNTYRLFSLDSGGKATLAATIELHDENGNELVGDRVVGRGDAIYLVCGHTIYRVDVQLVLAQL